MRVPLSLSIAMAIGLGLFQPLPSVAACPQLQISTIYVSTIGDDNWSGLSPTQQGGSDGPLKTLQGARDKLRVYRTGGCLTTTDPIHVKILSGEYFLAQSLVLTQEDSGLAPDKPVIFEPYAIGRPVITGGKRLTGFTVEPNGNWRLQLPEFQSSDPNHWKFEQLWVNGRRAIPARAPNRASYSESTPTQGFFQRQPYPSPSPSPTPSPKDHFIVGSEVMGLLSPLSTTQLADVQITHMDIWTVSRNFVHSLQGADRVNLGTSEDGLAKMWTTPNPPPSMSRLELLNVPTALDAPGEFYLDRTPGVGVLLYRPFPGEKPALAEVIAPRINAPELILVDGAAGSPAHDIRFEHLNLRHSPYLLRRIWVDHDKFTSGYNDSYGGFSLPAAITVRDARDIVLDDLEVAHTGATAVWMDASTHVTVKNCRMHDLGGGGIKVVSFNPSVAYGYCLSNLGSTIETGGNHVIEDNVIHSGGRSFYDTNGILIVASAGNLVAHNDVGDFYNSGVSLVTARRCNVIYPDDHAAHDNLVQFNRIHQIGQEVMSDLGGLYFTGFNEESVAEYNEIYYVRHWGATPSQWGGTGHQGTGIYLDSGASGMDVTNTVVYDTETAGTWINVGQDRTVQNNVFAFAQEGAAVYSFGNCFPVITIGPPPECPAVHVDPQPPPEPFAHAERNILFFDGYASQGYAAINYGAFSPTLGVVNHNVYHKLGADDVLWVLNLYTPPGDPIPFWQWQSQGADQDSRFFDPLFVDPFSWNFTLQSNSPATQPPINFVPIDPPEPIGVTPTSPAYGFAARLEAPPVDFGGMFGFGTTPGSPPPQVIYGNPLYGDLPACPPGYTETRVLGTLGTDNVMSYCHRPTDDRPPLAYFGGMFGVVDGVTVRNVYSGTYGCALGYTAKQVLTSAVPVDSALFYCYRPYTPGEPAPMPWGGTFGLYYDQLLQDNAINPNPLDRRLPTLLSQLNPPNPGNFGCPSGFKRYQVYGTSGVDYPVYYCVNVP
jgi:parallel beta helix pectate lyase-like protein